MASNQEHTQWLDSISRTEIGDAVINVSEDPDDDDYKGFHGLTGTVYRVCRPDEDLQKDIECRDPNSTRTVEQHVASGRKYPSRFISCTANDEVARLWAYYAMHTKTRAKRKNPLRIIKISVDKLKSTETEGHCINLTNESVRNHFIKGSTNRSWVISSQEVLFEYSIPKASFAIWPNPPVPDPPGPKPVGID